MDLPIISPWYIYIYTYIHILYTIAVQYIKIGELGNPIVHCYVRVLDESFSYTHYMPIHTPFSQWPFQEQIDGRYLPYISPIFQAYVRGYTPKIWSLVPPFKWTSGFPLILGNQGDGVNSSGAKGALDEASTMGWMELAISFNHTILGTFQHWRTELISFALLVWGDMFRVLFGPGEPHGIETTTIGIDRP